MARRNAEAKCSFCRKSYKEVGPLVEGPGEVYICGDCVELSESIIKQEKKRRSPSAQSKTAAVDRGVLRSKLDQLVSGQSGAKDALVEAAHHRAEAGRVLLTGPHRSGKILLSRALAYALEVPFASGGVSELVKSEGGPQEGIPLLLKLLAASDYDLEAAQHGVVYVDGVDVPESQGQLLRLWRGEVSNVLGQMPFDVRGILFVCGGAFSRLDPTASPVDVTLQIAIAEGNLDSFGILPEWHRYLRALATVSPLEEETLVRIIPWLDFGRSIDPRKAES